jgi:6-phosphogluconolactonase (cycloisomerase 2 family)
MGLRATALIVAALALLVVVGAGVAHAAPGSLAFVEQDRDGADGVTGLSLATGVAVSPDGSSVYTAAFSGSVAAFSRDPATGALSFVEAETDGAGGVNGIGSSSSVAVSPDGAHVYVTGFSDNALATFARDGGTGALTFVEFEMDGVGGVDGLSEARQVAVSPDGAHVYASGATDDAVAAFSRSPTTGALAFIEAEKDGVGGVEGLNSAAGVSVSPDGNHVYVAGQADNAIATFARDPSTGALTFVELDQDGAGGVDGLAGAFGVSSSLDGNNVYVAAGADSAVASFLRDPSSGALTFVDQDRDGVDGVEGLALAGDVVASPDGANVYVGGATDKAVVTFSRDPVTGTLGFVEFDQDGVDGVDGLEQTAGIAASPDDRNIYAVGNVDDAVVTFSREPPAAADTDPPETTITKGPKKKTRKRKAKFAFASDEPGSTFLCKLDKKDFAPCEQSERFKVKRRKHELQVAAIDPAGNTDPTPANRKWKVRKEKKN